MQKYETYKSMYESLSKALKNEFYYEAIFIEYAILEDRLASVLKYAEIPYTDKNRQDISIKAKLNKIESRKERSDKFYKERLTSVLIQKCRVWTDERNSLIHHMANLPYDSEKVRQIAIDGNELVRLVKNKTASAINRLKREYKGSVEAIHVGQIWFLVVLLEVEVYIFVFRRVLNCVWGKTGNKGSTVHSNFCKKYVFTRKFYAMAV